MEQSLEADPFLNETLTEIKRRSAGDMSRILAHLRCPEDVKVLQLEKDIALFTYSEERRKSEIIEQRAFNLMQFAKVGLTVIIGIAGVISAANVQDSPMRESLIFLLAVAAAFLGKLFYRGVNVVKIGTIFSKPSRDSHFKPDHHDIYEVQESQNYNEALRKHLAWLILYFDHTAKDNRNRITQCKCCYVNLIGFLISFLVFFGLCVAHLFEPRLTLVLPAHRLIGTTLLVLAFITDNIALCLKLGWFDVEPEIRRF
jgi:hypothetical protein